MILSSSRESSLGSISPALATPSSNYRKSPNSPTLRLSITITARNLRRSDFDATEASKRGSVAWIRSINPCPT